MQFKNNPMNKKKFAAIISVVVAFMVIVGISVFFVTRHIKSVEASNTTAESISSTKPITESETEPATDPETETESETTTEEIIKPPAEPSTKEYKSTTTTTILPTQKPTTTAKSVKLNVTLVLQRPKYPTGCEAASATMVLNYHGYNISLDEMIESVPREDLYKENGRLYGPSMYEKFAGDPRKTYTDECPGYGAYSPVITKALNTVLSKKGGKHTAKNITGCSFSTLLSQIDSGHPIIVWATSNMTTLKYSPANSWYIKNPGGEDTYFEYPRGMHVMVLTGYDSTYVYIADPWYGQVKFTRSAFNDKWALLGKQAIILENKQQETTTESTTVAKETTETTTKPVTQTTTKPVTETTTKPTTVPETER